MVLENDCHTASLMPHFDIVYAVIRNLEPILRKPPSFQIGLG